MLRTGALAALGGVAGCLNGTVANAADDPNPLDTVPGSATAATHVDVATLLDGDGYRAAANAWLGARAESRLYYGPADVATGIDRFESWTGLDAEGLSTLTWFADLERSADPGAGFVFDADWETSAVVSGMEGDGDYLREGTYNGRTVYRRSSGRGRWLGVLGDGEHAVGPGAAVRETIDVREDDAAPLSEPLRDGYANTRSGPIGFVAEPPAARLPATYRVGGERFELGILSELSYVAGRVFGDGGNRGVALRFAAGDGETAEDVADLFGGAVTAAESAADHDAVAAAMDATSVRRDGDLALLTYEQPLDAVERTLARLGEPRRDPPAVAVGFDYDADAEVLVITHEAGDTVDADALYVRGEGFADVDGVDTTAPGPWAGTTSGEGDVRAGDETTVGAAPDHEISVVWESTEGEDAATLAVTQGPKA